MNRKLSLIRLFSEFVATCMLVFLGCMGCAISGDNSTLKASLNFGLVSMAMIHCFYFISGAFANPVITLTALVLRYIPLSQALAYIGVQFLGAFAGYLLLQALLPYQMIFGESPGLCVSVPNPNISLKEAFLIEFGLTSVLLFGYCATWDFRNNMLESSSITTGLLFTACCLCGGYFTGCSLNPARSVAAALFHGYFTNLWLYIVSQMLAALLIGFGWRTFYTPKFRIVFPHPMQTRNDRQGLRLRH